MKLQPHLVLIYRRLTILAEAFSPKPVGTAPRKTPLLESDSRFQDMLLEGVDCVSALDRVWLTEKRLDLESTPDVMMKLQKSSAALEADSTVW